MNLQDAVLARRYAAALFMAARDARALEEVRREIADLAELCRPGATARALSDPRLSGPDKCGALKRALGRIPHAVTARFVDLIVEKRRLSLVPAVAVSLEEKADEAAGIARARVRSAVPLGEAQAKSLSRALEKTLAAGGDAGSTVVLDVVVDPSLLGGVTVRVGDRLWDLSFKGRLAALKEQILESN
jgi:F-type H+-transporting ATPase subunit delta